jgi:hypothetical protein
MVLGTITDVDDLHLNITIPELARSLVVQFGGTVPNGDSGATLLDASVGAVQDIAGNLNVISAGLVCREEHDLILPTMESGTINYGTGVLVLTFSEIVDATPTTNLDGSKIRLSNTAGDSSVVTQSPPLSGETTVSLTGAVVSVQSDSTLLTLTLTELQRASAIALSATAGGDASVLVIDVDTGAARDVGTNLIAGATGVTLVETADSVIPTILSATLDYSTGVLVVTSNEFIDTTGIDQVDVDQLYLSNGNDFITWTVTIDEQSLTKGQGVAVAQASNSGTLTVAWTGGLGTTIVITSAADQVFDTAADLIVGGTQINAANLVSVSSTTTNGQFHIDRKSVV